MDRYIIISWQELNDKSLQHCMLFLWFCYKQFLKYKQSRPDNLVMLWESDYNELIKSAKVNNNKGIANNDYTR